MRISENALLARDAGWRIVAKARYTLESSTVNHQLSGSTKQVLITSKTSDDATAYIDFDEVNPQSSEAPLILAGSTSVCIPAEGIAVLNIMGDAGVEIGILELGWA
ncbi:MAG: hypothetical protein N3G75_07700 [Methanothrix sp.]|nr:hypothetical protein [Methanothrix sp.]MCX8207698.1 hypothetical protein [Methanothrix sp.]